jgi:hypothetical protein
VECVHAWQPHKLVSSFIVLQAKFTLSKFFMSGAVVLLAGKVVDKVCPLFQFKRFLRSLLLLNRIELLSATESPVQQVVIGNWVRFCHAAHASVAAAHITQGTEPDL